MSSLQMGEHIHFYEKLASINYQSFKHLLREWPPRPTTDVRERISQEPRLWPSLVAGDDKSSFGFQTFVSALLTTEPSCPQQTQLLPILSSIVLELKKKNKSQQ